MPKPKPTGNPLAAVAEFLAPKTKPKTATTIESWQSISQARVEMDKGPSRILVVGKAPKGYFWEVWEDKEGDDSSFAERSLLESGIADTSFAAKIAAEEANNHVVSAHPREIGSIAPLRTYTPESIRYVEKRKKMPRPALLFKVSKTGEVETFRVVSDTQKAYRAQGDNGSDWRVPKDGVGSNGWFADKQQANRVATERRGKVGPAKRDTSGKGVLPTVEKPVKRDIGRISTSGKG
jgi:hypothetical protein